MEKIKIKRLGKSNAREVEKKKKSWKTCNVGISFIPSEIFKDFAFELIINSEQNKFHKYNSIRKIKTTRIFLVCTRMR